MQPHFFPCFHWLHGPVTSIPEGIGVSILSIPLLNGANSKFFSGIYVNWERLYVLEGRAPLAYTHTIVTQYKAGLPVIGLWCVFVISVRLL